MVKTEGTYIQVAYKNVFGYISTNSWPFFMIQRPTIREKCAWVRSNTWRDKRPVAAGLDRFFSVFRFFDKCHNWQPKKFRICATATGGPVFCSWVQFDFGLFSSPANWTCEHYYHRRSTPMMERRRSWHKFSFPRSQIYPGSPRTTIIQNHSCHRRLSPRSRLHARSKGCRPSNQVAQTRSQMLFFRSASSSCWITWFICSEVSLSW